MELYSLETHDVCAIHNEIIVESGGEAGILNEGALESTLSPEICIITKKV